MRQKTAIVYIVPYRKPTQVDEERESLRPAEEYAKGHRQNGPVTWGEGVPARSRPQRK